MEYYAFYHGAHWLRGPSMEQGVDKAESMIFYLYVSQIP